jgi:hypothetical protein
MARDRPAGPGVPTAAEAVADHAGPGAAPEPELALVHLAATLREERSVISAHVVEADPAPALGLLAAAGPRGAAAPGEYALLVETIREGYLLHYGTPRLLRGHDEDIGLLCGDYLYALGLDRLAALGDLAAVAELSDLISLSALVHAEGAPERAGAALWLGSVTAVGCGAGVAHEAAKTALREGRGSAVATWRAAHRTADRCGVSDSLRAAAEAIDFGPLDDPEIG